jgi:hypothetical protein
MPSQTKDDPAGGGDGRQQNSLLVSAYCWLIAKTEAIFVRLSNRRHWLLIGTAIAIAMSLFVTFPRVSYFTGKDEQIPNFWPYIAEQARDPLSTGLEIYQKPLDHTGKMAFRLTLPMAARVLHLGEYGLIALQMILGVLLLLAVGRIVEQLYRDRVTALAAVFAVSSIFAGKASFIELGGVGDGWAFACLVFAACFRSVPIVFLAGLAACFTDERGAVALPLIAVYWAIRDAGDGRKLAWFTPPALAAAAALAGYLVLRLYLGYRYGLHTPVGNDFGVGFSNVVYNLGRIQWELPRALAGLWIPVVVALVLLWRARHLATLALIAIGSSAIIAAALTVGDFQRSLAYLLPLVLIAFAVAARRGLMMADAREIAIASFLVSLLMPVNSYFAVYNRYADSNLFPVEMARLIQYVRK